MIKNWVRAIDYIYLFVSSFSLVKLVISQIHPGSDFKGYNALAAVAPGAALALRITKTSIEVWSWDDPEMPLKRMKRKLEAAAASP